MRDDATKYKDYTRRAVILGGLKLSLLSVILSRYYYLQISSEEKYGTLSDKNRIKLQIIPAIRGKILGVGGEEIANDKAAFSLVLDPLQLKNLTQITTSLNSIVSDNIISSEDALRKKAQKRAPSDPLILCEDLPWKEVVKITEQLDAIDGVEILETRSRQYTEGEAFCHLTGYIGSPTEADVEKYDLVKSDLLKIGKAGLESKFDEELRGQYGLKRTEVNVKGKFVREISRSDPVPGINLQTTINKELQIFIHNLMKANSYNGAVVVLNVKTGDVMAIYSSPTFDPNKFVTGVSREYWEEINQSDANPLINNATSIPYPPGSTFKIITALAILEAGIDPNRTVFCNGSYKLGSHTFKCWNQHGHGEVNLTKAIMFSCNPYFYHFSQQIGINRISETSRILGYGRKTGVELPFEHDGLVPDQKWKKSRFKMDWYPGDTVNTSIGQGYLLVTPIQIASMTAMIASGKYVVPRLISNPNVDIQIHDLPFKKENLELIRTGMRMTVNDPSGVVSRHQMSQPGFTVAGKTGTAQVAALKFKDKAKNLNHHALFTSFAPVEDPQYAVTVVVEHGQAGGKAAAPIAKQIYLKLLGKKTAFDVDATDF